MISLNIKKRKLKRILLRKGLYTEENALMYLFINNGVLDNIINTLDNRKTITNSKSIIKKGYLTSEEQFLNVLYFIINKFNDDFWFLGQNKNLVIEYILDNSETKLLLDSKKYIGDNSNISYYLYHTQLAIITNFLNVLKLIDRSNIDHFFKSNKINLDQFNMKDEKQIKKIYKLIQIICLCNYNSFQLLNVFHSLQGKENLKFYQFQMEMLIERTIKNQKGANLILNNRF